MKLNYKELGENKLQSLVILHGLYGSLDNWITLAKYFAEHFHVYLVDQRNHGKSPHDDSFSYQVMADDLNEAEAGNEPAATQYDEDIFTGPLNPLSAKSYILTAFAASEAILVAVKPEEQRYTLGMEDVLGTRQWQLMSPLA